MRFVLSLLVIQRTISQGNGLGNQRGERRPCWAWLYSEFSLLGWCDHSKVGERRRWETTPFARWDVMQCAF